MTSPPFIFTFVFLLLLVPRGSMWKPVRSLQLETQHNNRKAAASLNRVARVRTGSCWFRAICLGHSGGTGSGRSPWHWSIDHCKQLVTCYLILLFILSVPWAFSLSWCFYSNQSLFQNGSCSIPILLFPLKTGVSWGSGQQQCPTELPGNRLWLTCVLTP